MIVFTTTADYFIDSEIHISRLPYKILYWALVGVIVGFTSWWTMEGRYKNAKLEARIKDGLQQ